MNEGKYEIWELMNEAKPSHLLTMTSIENFRIRPAHGMSITITKLYCKKHFTCTDFQYNIEILYLSNFCTGKRFQTFLQ